MNNSNINRASLPTTGFKLRDVYCVICKFNSISIFQVKYKMMPFHRCFLTFHGFSDDEKKHMEESTEQQGKAGSGFHMTSSKKKLSLDYGHARTDQDVRCM